MKNHRFTAYNDYPYDHIAKRALEKNIITNEDHDHIIQYIKNKKSKGVIEDARAQRISTSLTQWRRFIKAPYDKMTYNNMLDGIAAMRSGSNKYGKPFESGTIRQQIKILKTFTKHLSKNKVVNITRDELDEIKYPKEVFDSVKSKDILSPELIEQLIGAAVSIRDKAIIGIMADTGLRPSDVTGLSWRDLDFGPQRVKITITTEKTTTPITCYVVLHKSWLEEYRKQRNMAGDDDFVFVDNNNDPVTYMAVNHLLERAAAKCNYKFPKRAKAKLFRATSITNKQRAGYSTAAISKTHFGVPDSKMMRHYSKLCDEDTERETLEKSGAVQVEKKEQPRNDICPNLKCNWPISPGVKFCPECGIPLTEKARAAHDDYERKAMDLRRDPEMIEAMIKKLQCELEQSKK